MSRAMVVAAVASMALHAAVLAAFWGGAPRGVAEPPDQGAGITVVWSLGGGGERSGGPSREAGEGEAAPAAPAVAAASPAEAPAAAMREAAEPIPDRPPDAAGDAGTAAGPVTREPAPAPVEIAALPLPPLPPPIQAPRSAAVPAPPSRPAPPSPGAEAGGGSGLTGFGDPTAGRLFATNPSTVGHKVDPAYPIEARRNRWQGTVVLAVTISPDGIPTAVEIARSSGYSLLDRSAAEAMWRWRFDPARRGGQPVEDRIAIPITFRLID